MKIISLPYHWAEKPTEENWDWWVQCHLRQWPYV